MRWSEFAEARRNPERSPKTSPNQILRDLVAKTSSTIRRSRYKNLFVSFTSLPKFGINPGSTYNTPLGIYAYPAEYVEQEVGPNRTMSNMPFAGDQPWVNIFRARDDIVNLSRLRNDGELIGYYEDLRAIMSPFEKGEMRGGYMHYEEFVDEYASEAPENAKVDSPGGHLWYVTMKCAEIISARKGIAKPVAWNWIFRQLGIDGFIDEGDGIIHENEPTQAVFFSKNSVDLVERVANKYSPDRVSARVQVGQINKKESSEKLAELRKILQSNSFADIIEWCDWGTNYRFLKYVPRGLRPQILSLRPFYIHSLKHPSKQELMAALSASPVQFTESMKSMLSVPEITAAITAYNDNPDINKLIHARDVAEIATKVNSDDPEFIRQLIVMNPYVWNDILSYYSHLNTREYYEMVLHIAAEKQGYNSVVQRMQEILQYDK